MTKTISAEAMLVLVFFAQLLLPQPARASDCAATAIVARGEESSFVWLAKVKARAHWRQKVRSMPGLGPNYANWARAQNTEERCLSGGAGAVCIFTGTPCLP